MYTFKMTHLFEKGKKYHDKAERSQEFIQAEATLRQYEADNNTQRTESWPDINRCVETWIFPSKAVAQQWKIQFDNLLMKDSLGEDGVLMGYVKTQDNELKIRNID